MAITDGDFFTPAPTLTLEAFPFSLELGYSPVFFGLTLSRDGSQYDRN
jgi:hypothetical protein